MAQFFTPSPQEHIGTDMNSASMVAAVCESAGWIDVCRLSPEMNLSPETVQAILELSVRTAGYEDGNPVSIAQLEDPEIAPDGMFVAAYPFWGKVYLLSAEALTNVSPNLKHTSPVDRVYNPHY